MVYIRLPARERSHTAARSRCGRGVELVNEHGIAMHTVTNVHNAQGEVVRLTSTRRLPLPHTSVYDWKRRAACRSVNSTLFFGPIGEPAGARRKREEEAKIVCTGCPVQLACRQHALDAAEPYGSWGGLTPEERYAQTRVAISRT